MMNQRVLLFLTCFSVLFSSSHAQSSLADQGRYWRGLFGIERWEMDLDADRDGQSSRGEYFAGTDPKDPASKLEMRISSEAPLFFLDWQSQLDARYQMLESEDLQLFAPFGDLLIGTGGLLRIPVDPSEEEGTGDRHIFSLGVRAPLDTDDDGLSDREEAILGTNPELKNTDGDSYEDGAEVFDTFTDPLVFDPSGGTIRGSIRLVGSLTATFESGDPLPKKTVFIDGNFNGLLDDGERRTLTDDDGAYEFLDLPPGFYEVRQVLKSGETQTLPAEQTPELPDRLPDELLNYTHPESGAAMDEPYGWAPIDVWPGAERFNVFPRSIAPVDPALLLLPIGVRAQNPPIGSYPTSHHIALPDTASVTVGFDETIIDKDGTDFIIAIPTQGTGGNTESALIAFGPSESELFEFQESEVFGGDSKQINEVDLADYPQIAFVKVIRVTSQTSGIVASNNSDGGFGLAGFEAINFLPLNSEARRIRILGSEVFEDENFARYFQDLPPSLILSSDGTQPQAGQSFTFRLIAIDDLGVASLNATANGSSVALTSENYGSVTPGFPGELLITATVTDTGGQSTTRNWTFYVLDENGELPYDPEVLAEQQGGGSTRIQVFTPNSGDVPTTDVPIIGSIVAPTGETPNWSVSYAPIDLVDPLDLATPDPDYLPLGSGSENVFSAPLVTFPTESLADGIYLLKIEAIPAGGGLGNFYGQIIGVGIDPATIRPQIEITSPENGTHSDLVQDITGSIISTRPLDSWEVAYAPLEEVDLSNLGNGDAWKTIASGTETIADGLLGTLDTSLIANGSYLVRVTAYNDLRLGIVEGIQLEVTSPAKPGRTRRLFTDLTLDLHSLPIKIDRVYDSLNLDRVGDFGNGWCLDIADANILETVPDTGLNLFGATPYRQGTRIYLNAPDGQRVAFTFEAEFGNPSLLGNIYRATFIPDTGNPYTLETPEGSSPFLNLLPSGEIALTFIGLPWNPDRFILTDMQGISHSYHEDQGLTGIEDRNGNTLEYANSGITHSAGPAVVFNRDAEGRITTITGPGGEFWSYAYSVAGDLISVTDPGGNTTTFDYDPANPHYLTTVTDPFGRMGIRFEYDEDGRLVAVIDEFGNREEQSWDPAALTGSITDRNGNLTLLVYDDRGNVLTATDPLGNVTTFKYDDERHPDIETETITENTSIRHTLNDFGLPTATYYGGERFADFRTTYNELGQVTEQTFFGAQLEKSTYDEKGNLLTRRGALSGSWEELTYNRFSLVETESWHAPDDSIERMFTYTYTKSRLNSVTDGTSTWTLSGGLNQFRPARLIYEFAGQEKFELSTSWTSFREYPVPAQIRIVDAADSFFVSDVRADFLGDRNVGMKFDMPDETKGSVRLRFDKDGRPTEVARHDFFSSAFYNAEPVSRTHRSYDQVGDLASIRHEKPDGTLVFPVADFTFARDPGGRIVTRTQPGNSSNYTYDSTDQITAVTHSGFTDETYSYNLAGNPTSATTGADNRLLTFEGLTFTYDAEGNLATQTDDVTGEVRTYDYDHRNQLIAVTLNSVTIAEYKYDYRGRMMYRVENGQKNWILHERNNPHAEFAEGASEVNRVYLYNVDKPEEVYGVWTADDGIRWHLTDQIGSVQGIVAPDGAGLHWLDYDTFGVPRTAVPADFGSLRFAGRYFNEAIGLYENTVRHYNPRLRRFQQQDPIRHESLDFNYYRYAENDPLSKTDPLGTTAAVSYGTLLKKLSKCARASEAVGNCVNGMLNAAAQGLQGKMTEVDVGCAKSAPQGISKNCSAAGP